MAAHFGEHLTLDGYGGDHERLNDERLVTELLADLPRTIDMHPLTAPKVVFAPGNGGKDPGGWSGFVMIEESHISIHTFPQRGFLSADIYTCKNGMDTDPIVAYFVEMFGLQDVEVNFLVRGTRYPVENFPRGVTEAPRVPTDNE